MAESVTDEKHVERYEYLHRRYPKPNDPRRDPSFGARETEFEIRQVLIAILDELQELNVRMAGNDG